MRLPFIVQQLDKEKGIFAPPVIQEEAAATMLEELLKWTTALKTLRA